MFSFPTDPSNPSHFYRINEFSGRAPVFPAKRRGGRNGCCSATKAVIARTFVLLSEGCRRRRETRGPRLASPRLPSFAQKQPHCFSWRKQCISCISRLPFKGGEKVQEAKGVEWRGVERRGRKKDAGKRRGKREAKKVVGARAKVRPRAHVRASLYRRNESSCNGFVPWLRKYIGKIEFRTEFPSFEGRRFQLLARATPRAIIFHHFND